ncbi:hypothetical protein TIFTF001_029681 [Ficus carica]|uniref:Uncharacterized protein n=1 Tax=Ficus carica TaxID=3494 RepID=A0AA88DSS7_FICCA|nr:hypothetical protein TIFTF001_029681 [Ficus carica]
MSGLLLLTPVFKTPQVKMIKLKVMRLTILQILAPPSITCKREAPRNDGDTGVVSAVGTPMLKSARILICVLSGPGCSGRPGRVGRLGLYAVSSRTPWASPAKGNSSCQSGWPQIMDGHPGLDLETGAGIMLAHHSRVPRVVATQAPDSDSYRLDKMSVPSTAAIRAEKDGRLGESSSLEQASGRLHWYSEVLGGVVVEFATCRMPRVGTAGGKTNRSFGMHAPRSGWRGGRGDLFTIACKEDYFAESCRELPRIKNRQRISESYRVCREGKELFLDFEMSDVTDSENEALSRSVDVTGDSDLGSSSSTSSSSSSSSGTPVTPTSRCRDGAARLEEILQVGAGTRLDRQFIRELRGAAPEPPVQANPANAASKRSAGQTSTSGCEGT